MRTIIDKQGWRVAIERSINALATNIYIFRLGNGFVEYVQPDSTMKKVVDGQIVNVQPILTFNWADGNQILQAFAETLADEGHNTPNDFKIQGLLEATKAHLADMRQLLKLK